MIMCPNCQVNEAPICHLRQPTFNDFQLSETIYVKFTSYNNALTTVSITYVAT